MGNQRLAFEIFGSRTGKTAGKNIGKISVDDALLFTGGENFGSLLIKGLHRQGDDDFIHYVFSDIGIEILKI
jgi:hypothetical protein